MDKRKENTHSCPWKKVISAIVRWLFLMFVLWFVFHEHYKKIYENICGIRLDFLLIIVLLGATYQVLGGVAFYKLAHKGHTDFTIRQSIVSIYVSYFGTIAALSVGALPLRICYLHRHGIEAGDAISLINNDYILHKSAVLICNTLLLLVSGRPFVEEQPYILKYILYGYLICLAIIFILVLVGFSNWIFEKVYIWIVKIPEKKKWKNVKEKLLSYLQSMHICGVEMKKNLGDNFKILMIHCAKLFIMYSIPFICSSVLYTENISFFQMVMLVGISNLVSSALPNVAGFGSTEVAFMLVFSNVFDEPTVSSILVLYRFATYFFPFIISCIVFACIERKQKRTGN